MDQRSEVIFDKNSIEFVTVAAEYCAVIEHTRQMERVSFVDTALKILPLLYLKASLLPAIELMGEDDLQVFVTEGDYEIVRSSVADILGEHDDYLEVFLPDMAYSDTPIKKCISEDLADIYQDLKDFICVFLSGFIIKLPLENSSKMDSQEWDGYRTISDTDHSHSENTNCYEIVNELWLSVL